MISCQQATREIAGGQLADGGWRRRLAVRLHLLLCRPCRCYEAQIATIGDIARRLYRQDDPVPSPDLEQALLERCRSAQPPDPPT